ncbi:MAG: DUF3788 family protein [Ignavibacteriaceae bacterium]|nr:DUF3788 family protein [Ignavibacteriaceae bacterium]
MEQPILSDKNQYPTDEVIYSHIGKSKKLWEEIFDHIQKIHPEISLEWRYYNDGKSWLLKAVKKAKTIFWLSIIKNSFRMTFYFGDKAEKEILKSGISDKLKESFIEGKRYGKIRGITVVFKTKKDVENAKLLIELKMKIK